MKKTKKDIYFRYEFSDETGRPEGGDIFRFPTIARAQKMAAEILKVANSDGVAVSLVIGEEKTFFGLLKKSGMSRKDAEREMVGEEISPLKAPKKASKKTKARKK